jgi:nicotinamide-nucleotide amidase
MMTHPELSNPPSDADITRLAAAVGSALAAKGLLLVSAESCTGGGIAEAITRIAGSSRWFDAAFVCYSYEAKARALGVPLALIEACGAVHSDVAAAMASGALARAPLAKVAVAVTGIAGPGGGTPMKPVGTVCFAWALPSASLRCETRVFGGDRATIRTATIAHALTVLHAMLTA